VDLGPSIGAFRGQCIAQTFGDGIEQMLVDNWVLFLADAQGGVLVGYAGQHGLRGGLRVLDQVGGEDCDGAGQGLLLGAFLLVRTGEDSVEQFRVGGEQAVVEVRGNAGDALCNDRQRCFDDRERLGGQHRVSLGVGDNLYLKYKIYDSFLRPVEKESTFTSPDDRPEWLTSLWGRQRAKRYRAPSGKGAP